jgi:hypothetical protein
MVPMHLGLKNRPFVPHKLISAQDSPVPLPKFQMAPRLQILMSCGSKKETQIYYPFLSESPGKQIPSRFLSGAPMERDTCLQGILCLSLNTLRTGDADLRLYITTVQDGWCRSAFLTSAWFPARSRRNYAIHGACLRMVLLMDVYRNLTSLWINDLW